MSHQDSGRTSFSEYPKVKESTSCGGILATLALVLLLVALPGCCSYPEAESALETGIEMNTLHAADENLTAETHTVAEKNGDLMWKALYNIGGCEEKDIPEAVLARQAQRVAKAGAK